MTSKSNVFRYAIVLGLLTAVGPLAIDMYLPVLPVIGTDLKASTSAVQASLMSFYVTLGAGQLLAGPLSDLYGRKRVLYSGLAMFFGASLGCAIAPTLEALVVLRMFEGLGACACMVTPRAVVRDLYAGPEAARLMSLLLAVYSVSPIVAPLVGSLIADASSWRGVFWTLTAAAVLAAALVRISLPETRPPSNERIGGMHAAWSGYRSLLADREFVALALIASLCVAMFAVFVANSPFVFLRHFGVSPREYALLFALNAVSFVAVSQMNGRWVARWGLRRTITTAVISQAMAVVAALVVTAAGVDRLGALTALLMIVFGLNGAIVPSAFVLAMEGHPTLAGRASALIGTLNFAGGAVAMAATAPFSDDSVLPMITGIGICSLVSLVLGLRSSMRVASCRS